MVFEEFDPKVRVIFTADNFGRSAKANQAVIRAFREGVLTSASLPMRCVALNDAVALAKENPGLEVGLQLVLLAGKSVLKPSEIIGLVDERFEFGDSLWSAVMRYGLNPRLRGPLQAEVDAQLRLFRRTGLPLGFISGRCGLHLHPAVFDLIRRYHEAWNIRSVRATHDPVLTHLRLQLGRSWRNIPRGLLLRYFDRHARTALVQRGISMPHHLLGSLTENRIDLDYLLDMLEQLPPGTYEVSCQPDEEEHAEELAALLSPELKEMLQNRGIELIRHTNLAAEAQPAVEEEPSGSRRRSGSPRRSHSRAHRH